MGLQLRGSVLGGLPASSVLPIPHPRPMGQLWGCRQVVAVGRGAGVGLQFPPMHSDSVLGGTEGAPLLLLSAAYRIHVPWGSCRTAGRQQLQAGGQVWGCSPPLHSEAHCWGALRGLPSFSSVFCTSSVSCEAAGGQVWGCSSEARCWGGSPPLQCSPYLIRVPWGSCGAAGRRQLWVGGQVWGCSPPPRCIQTQCWGALRGLPSFLLSALSLIHAPWGSCGAVSRQQVWGCSSGARCWGELRQWEGSPPSPQYCIPCPRPMGQVWGCRQQLGVGGQVWGCSPPCCTQTQCWGALRGLPCFFSVLCTSSMSHGAAVGLQACSSCRFWGRCGAAAPLVHSGAQCGGEGMTVGASFLLLSAPYFTHHPVGQLWGCKRAAVGQQLGDSVLGGGAEALGGLSFSVLRTSSTVLRGSCGAAGKCGAAAPWWARAQSWGN